MSDVVLFEWLECVDWNLLDSACCNSALRVELLEVFKQFKPCYLEGGHGGV